MDNFCRCTRVVLLRGYLLSESCQKSNKKYDKKQPNKWSRSCLTWLNPTQSNGPNIKKKQVERNGSAWHRVRFTCSLPQCWQGAQAQTGMYTENRRNIVPSSQLGKPNFFFFFLWTFSSPRPSLCLRHTTEVEAQGCVKHSYGPQLVKQQHVETPSTLPTRSSLASTGMSRHSRAVSLSSQTRLSAAVSELVSAEMRKRVKTPIRCAKASVNAL